MKTLSGPHTTALGAAVTKPAWLVQIDFATPLRMSSLGTISWSGQTWTAAGVSVEGLMVEAFRVQGSVVIQNLDGVIGNTILTDGIQDRNVTIYSYDGGATAAADVQWMASAVCAGATVGVEQARINLRHVFEFVASPRTYANALGGFTYMMKPDTVIRVDGVDYKFNRG